MTGFKAPIGVGFGFGSVWVADLDAQSIVRINPRSGQIVGRLPVGGKPILLRRLRLDLGSDDIGRVLRIAPRR